MEGGDWLHPSIHLVLVVSNLRFFRDSRAWANMLEPVTVDDDNWTYPRGVRLRLPPDRQHSLQLNGSDGHVDSVDKSQYGRTSFRG